MVLNSGHTGPIPRYLLVEGPNLLKRSDELLLCAPPNNHLSAASCMHGVKSVFARPLLKRHTAEVGELAAESRFARTLHVSSTRLRRTGCAESLSPTCSRKLDRHLD